MCTGPGRLPAGCLWFHSQRSVVFYVRFVIWIGSQFIDVHLRELANYVCLVWRKWHTLISSYLIAVVVDSVGCTTVFVIYN